MAQKIQEDMVDHMVKATPRSDYDWDQYVDNGWWALRRGTDYTVLTQSASTNAKNWAKGKGYRVRTANLKEGDGFALRIDSK